MTKACCVPDSGRESRATAGRVGNGAPSTTLVDVPGGCSHGRRAAWSYPGDGEGPVHEVGLTRSASMRRGDQREFAAFVAETGYVTEAERFGWSFVFAGFLPDDFPETRAWWARSGGVRCTAPTGATRRARSGPRRTWRPPGGARLVERRERVLRVGRHAAADRGRVGVRGARRARRSPFPWGDDLEPGGEHRMNVFQGSFPRRNTRPTARPGPRPWTRSRPTSSVCTTYRQRVGVVRRLVRRGLLRAQPGRQPPGRTRGEHRVMRGGSYLCHCRTVGGTRLGPSGQRAGVVDG